MSTSRSPETMARLFSSRAFRSSFRHRTGVRPNFQARTVSGSRRYSSPGMNSARWRSPAAAMRPKRRNRSNFTRWAQAKEALAQFWSRSWKPSS